MVHRQPAQPSSGRGRTQCRKAQGGEYEWKKWKALYEKTKEALKTPTVKEAVKKAAAAAVAEKAAAAERDTS